MAYREHDTALFARLEQLEDQCRLLEEERATLRAERDDLRRRLGKAMAVLRVIAGAKQMEKRLERSNQRPTADAAPTLEPTPPITTAAMNDVYQFVREEAAKSVDTSS
ncbi:MAG: hypothetical protein AAF938_15855 [Myxococcota bacterium]